MFFDSCFFTQCFMKNLCSQVFTQVVVSQKLFIMTLIFSFTFTMSWIRIQFWFKIQIWTRIRNPNVESESEFECRILMQFESKSQNLNVNLNLNLESECKSESEFRKKKNVNLNSNSETEPNRMKSIFSSVDSDLIRFYIYMLIGFKFIHSLKGICSNIWIILRIYISGQTMYHQGHYYQLIVVWLSCFP